jgi:transcription-repair coupling factor (superfamily II helicase)
VRRAYSYFLHPPWHKLTNDAKVRLEVIGAQTELGAGYTIAMRDLEIRGAGDLLGSRQSGHIASVGFALYTRMLAQAVRHRRSTIKGEIVKPELAEDVLIDIPLAAYIPTDYVSDSSLRLRLYRRMAVLDTMTEIDEMAGELADRFGAIPDPIDNLLFQLRVKTMAIAAAVASVTSEAGQIQIRLNADNGQGLYQLKKLLGSDVRVSRRGIWLGRGMSTREWQVTLVQTLEKLQESRRGSLATVVNSSG